MNMSYSKKTMIMSLCVALCIVLPQALRVIPNGDFVYRAVQIPIMLCGILCGCGGALLCAVVGCVVSMLISGFPAVPMFPVVMTELVLMGLVSALLAGVFKAHRGGGAVIYCVALSVLTGRVAAGLVAALLFSPGHESIALWIWGYVIAALPSFIVQLILLPAILKALEYSGFVSAPANANDAEAKPAQSDTPFSSP